VNLKRRRAGPYLPERDRFSFPLPENSRGGVIAIEGDLSPGMSLSEYEQGVFPWYNEEDLLLWQSPDPRFRNCEEGHQEKTI
jgi:leucyl/phenylalanyl-tRNA--protein transferase